MKTICLITCGMIVTAVLYGQESPLTGKVTDEEGNPLPGVSVLIKESGGGTQTNTEGIYTLSTPENAVIVFQLLGYVSREVPRGARSTINLSLETDQQQLEEVVVIGYGTQRAGDVTSAVASVKAEDFVKGAVRDAAQLIQGKVAGLSVATTSGDPTAGTQIRMRGMTTLASSTAPLVLIDGIPGDLSTVAPEDIAAVDVLKDGSAAAIYGTRGTNGVILITTRRAGGDRPATISYNGYLSVQRIANRPEFLTAEDYRRLIGEGYDFTDYGASTDWFDEISRTPVSHTHHLSFSGGGSQTNYTASINYRSWQGLFINSDDQRITGRADLNHSMFEGKLKFNLNAIVGTQEYWTGGDGSSFNDYVYRQSVIRNPTDSIRNWRGDWMERSIYFYDNPVAFLNESTGLNSSREYRLNGSVMLNPVEGLDMKLLVSGNKWTEVRGYSETKQHVSTVKNGRNGYASRGTSSRVDNLLEFTSSYSRDLGKHRLSLLGGYSYQDEKSEGFWMQNWDFPTDEYSYNRMQSGNALGRGEAPMNSSASMSKLIGFFGRLNYNWQDKYLFMASVRHEGSSKFGVNYRWGTFPAVSLGWRISNEPFMSNWSVVDDLKFRAGFGVTGTAPDADYESLVSLNYGDRFFDNGTWIQSLAPNRNPNPNLRWERKEEYNLGLDFAFFGRRLSGSLDLYRRATKDMLYNYQVPVPPYLFSSIFANVGEMKNEGIEVLLNVEAIRKPSFYWSTGVTYSTNSNKLVSLSNEQFQTTNDFFDAGHTGEPIQQSTHRVWIGEEIGSFYGYKSVDIDEEGHWIIEGADGAPKPISEAVQEDKKILGNGVPKHILGWHHDLRYKNLDLTVGMRGAFGFQILNFQRMYYENPKITQYNMLKSAFDPVYGKTVLNNDLAYVSYYIEDGDYWKIDNITLGYTLPAGSIKGVRNLRLYLSALNLVTLTGYKGIDPEVNFNGTAPGSDHRDKYPTTTTFTLGLNFTL
ncbi:TonB-linked SusC/RagA family outer membrane protein [Anseongella ginsenosidimutans]|uniref:TonB-linked SusC/RagA family outer membrane protein n=2 Tax=Anseongella ginsenosidimutans TaxID=496056 RepID=A0A4R3KXC6_9SPHI|nr:TonB-dependent receptor [Anseongella ginsenosidimutans]TCS90061.1 TonB-linked SusC/RagA family outer membrane protein [Anseongella ginsenosidimutans]